MFQHITAHLRVESLLTKLYVMFTNTIDVSNTTTVLDILVYSNNIRASSGL